MHAPGQPGVSRRIALGAIALWLASPAIAAAGPPAELRAELPDARLAGSGRLTYFGLGVYNIRLWVAEGFGASTFAQHPFAIEIEYLHALNGRQIAERSLAEMQRVGGVPPELKGPWLLALQQTIPDVHKGDRLTGLYLPGQPLRLFVNGRPHAELLDAEFARAFTGIWLSPKTSEPQLRLAMLGAAP